MPSLSSSLRPEWVDFSQRQIRNRYRKLRSLQDLADFWRVKPSQLSYYAFRVDKNRVYKTFSVPRRNGGQRQIEAPRRTLKYLQRLMHESLSIMYGAHPSAHGFLSGHSIVTNARRHRNSQYILNTDLANFFPSITRKRIYGRLTAAPYLLYRNVANVIAALSTNAHSQLPQGSPSSPVLANIVASELDADLASLCRPFGCRYTRYADDITVSCPRGEMPPQIARYPNAHGTSQVVLGDALVDVIEGHGFQINYRKTRLQSCRTRQVCTGLVVNGDSISPPRPYIRRLRSLIHHWQKKGWEHAAHILSSKENRSLLTDRHALLNHVIGRIGYLKMVRGQNDPVALRLEQTVSSIPPNF